MSTLALTFGNIRREVQRYFGLGRATTWDNLSEAAKGDVLTAIERGLRQFYAPPLMPGESSAHEWSFLQGSGVITTIAPYTTGTVTVSGAAVTGSGTTFTSAMVGRLFYANGETREISARASNTAITLDRALDTNITSAASYEIVAHEYDLAADFGGIRGQITFDDSDGFVPLRVVNDSIIRNLRATGGYLKEQASYAAIVPKAVDGDTTSQQVYTLEIWPFPDKVYELHYNYSVLTDSGMEDAVVGDGNQADPVDGNYPVGGMIHGETIMSSCLAICEQMVDEFNNPGKLQAKYIERLASSISYDRRNMLPSYFGYNADNSDRRTIYPSRRRIQTSTYTDGSGTVFPS